MERPHGRAPRFAPVVRAVRALPQLTVAADVCRSRATLQNPRPAGRQATCRRARAELAQLPLRQDGDEQPADEIERRLAETVDEVGALLRVSPSAGSGASPRRRRRRRARADACRGCSRRKGRLEGASPSGRARRRASSSASAAGRSCTAMPRGRDRGASARRAARSRRSAPSGSVWAPSRSKRTGRRRRGAAVEPQRGHASTSSPASEPRHPRARRSAFNTRRSGSWPKLRERAGCLGHIAASSPAAGPHADAAAGSSRHRRNDA